MRFRIILPIIIFFSFLIFAQDGTQTFLSIESTGVSEFHKLYPEYDGRGTIILVLDTGVDIGIDGLTKTSTGEAKVIDVQDFTHEGDVQFFEADKDNEEGKTIFKNEENNYSVSSAGTLKYSPVDNNYYIGAFKEEILINSTSGAADLNGDGDTEDAYHFITFETSEGGQNFWIVYMDTNGNGDLSDEKPLRNYKENLDAFSIENQQGLTELTMGLNIFPEEKIVAFHFDDGAHGTHVAGIATGNSIGGIGLNGIAPGANLISLKLGNNLYSGGATVTESMKKAYLYADKISKEMKVPCIINMSFGIGSEIEGKAEMEAFLDNLTKENPYLYICLGNGNEGPGISNCGLPSSSYSVFSSGAILTQEVGRDLYGASLNKDVILFFSSRGGEVNKPDVCSPGACTSTVPNWTGWDRFWGTSMAAPYSAGVMSLLLSAASKEYPNVKIPSQLLYKAVREGAAYIEGYSHLDQGHGYINAINAYKMLKKYIDSGEVEKFETYTISSTAPNTPDGKASNLYLRNGSFVKDEDVFTYSITRNDFQKTDKFYRSYNIKSDTDWLIPIQKKTYIRNDQQTLINVKFDKSKMTSPGLYTGRITAYRDDASAFPEFEMLATVVIPFRFNSENNYKMGWKDKKVEQGMVDRYFIELPAGQTSMNVTLSAVPNKYARLRYMIFDPDGIELDVTGQLQTLNGDQKLEKSYFDLKPGVYEVDVEGFFLAKDFSNYDLTIEFDGINRLDNKTISVDNNQIEVVNLFNEVKNYNLNGKITGYKNEEKITVAGSEKFRMPFVLRKGEQSKEFKITLSKEDYNKFTDFSILIYDTEGIAVNKNGLSFREGSVDVENSSDADSTGFIFEIVPAFTNETDEAAVELTITTEFFSEHQIGVIHNKKPMITLYPSLPKTLQLYIEKPDEYFPDDSIPAGKIYFEATSTEKIEYELSINFNF